MARQTAIYHDFKQLGALRGKKVAMTLGIFDGIHRGHIQLFELTRELAVDMRGIPLIFTFANHPLQVLEPKRDVKFITLPREKMFLLRKLGFEHVACFDFAQEFMKLHAYQFFAKLRRIFQLCAFVAGHDTTLGSDRVSTDDRFNELARQHSFEFFRVGPVTDGGEPISSRRIRQLISEGNIAAANELLVYPYFVRGRVQPGRGIGTRLLKIPTANLHLPAEKLLPREGVYAGSFHRNRRHFPAALVVVPIGRRPGFLPRKAYEENTEDEANAESGGMMVEGHIVGEDVSLQGRTAEFIFLERLRDNRRFRAIDKLQAQIEEDIAATNRVFERSVVRLQFLP